MDTCVDQADAILSLPTMDLSGAELTPEAVRMMAAYDDYCRKLRAFADELFQEECGYLQEENGDL